MPKINIFYFCYSHNNPTGGQKHTYRHVDILNEHGFNAWVFHPTEDFRLTWFDNETPVIGLAEFKKRFNPREDFVVVPEDLGLRIMELPGRKVVFNKNLFHGFGCYGQASDVRYPYHSPEVVAALTVSEHNRANLQFAYPHLEVHHVHLQIEPDIYCYRPLVHKKRQIASIAKAPESLLAVYHTIQSRAAAGLNPGKSFNWIFLGNKSEHETAEILRESLLFLFFSVAEGLGRMPLEAMASGCLIAAYGYGPLQETIPARFRFEHSNIIEIVKYIETIMASFPDDLAQWNTYVQEGLQAAATFGQQREEESVLAAWEKILKAA